LENAERYTGYAGESAAKVWNNIYSENCFEVTKGMGTFLPNPDLCTEKKVFYRLISGLHSSISLHICGEYWDSFKNVWFKNTTCYIDRFQGYPERIDNLYFLWSVLVRAVSKLSPYLQNYPFCSGTRDEEIVAVRKIVTELETC
jgi:ERO1-like protein beta